MVGNDKSLKVWTDMWIEDIRMKAPLIKNGIIDVCQTVDQLIDFNTRKWDRDKLEELFYPNDVSLILRMHPAISREDFWCWKYNKGGEYSVKSGYWLAHRSKHADLIHMAEMQPSMSEIKKNVWKTQTSPKIQMFIWKAVSEVVPVVDLLLRKRIPIDSRCQVCGLEGESINHVLFSCTLARQIWAMSDYPSPRGGFDEISICSNMHYLFKTAICKKVPLEIKRLFPWLLWYLWKNRNGLCFEGKAFGADEVVEKAKKESELWFLAQSKENKEGLGINQQKQWVKKTWEKPPEPWLKCNIGTAWSKEERSVGAAWVFRNSEGRVILHSRRSFVGVGSLDEAKFVSHIWTFESMVAHKFNKVRFGSCVSDFIKALERPRAWPS